MSPYRAVLIMILVGCSADARLLDRSWTYQQMFDKADLVVIATASGTKDTAERTTLDEANVRGVETSFTTALVLKGQRDLKTFVLHHYQLENEHDPNSAEMTVMLLSIPPGYHRTFLMFLVKEKDGRYAPATGQKDPALFSILNLNGAADPATWAK